jgi:ATP-dependent DNA ligase
MQSQSEKTYPILYGISKTEKKKQWVISVKLNPDKTATIETQNGYVDGKMNISHRIITTGKNIGKKNETSVFEQAVSEADRKYKDKIEKDGYSTDADNIEEKVYPMLANNFDPDATKKSGIVFPCFVQPKMDGIRCMTHPNKKGGITFLSRNGMEYKGMDHLEPELEKFFEITKKLGYPNIYADGELFTTEIPFEEINGCVRMDETDDPEKDAKLKLIDYHIYDIYDSKNKELGYEARKKILDSIFKKKKFKKLINVETQEISSKEKVKEVHDTYVEKGFEGLILRNKLGPYLLGFRSNDLMKFKAFQDNEFEICGYEEAQGDDIGTIKWKCYYTKNDGTQGIFTVRPQGTREFRRKLFQDAEKNFKKYFLGKMLTVRYLTLNKYGCPTQLTAVGIRKDI